MLLVLAAASFPTGSFGHARTKEAALECFECCPVGALVLLLVERPLSAELLEEHFLEALSCLRKTSSRR